MSDHSDRAGQSENSAVINASLLERLKRLEEKLDRPTESRHHGRRDRSRSRIRSRSKTRAPKRVPTSRRHRDRDRYYSHSRDRHSYGPSSPRHYSHGRHSDSHDDRSRSCQSDRSDNYHKYRNRTPPGANYFDFQENIDAEYTNSPANNPTPGENVIITEQNKNLDEQTLKILGDDPLAPQVQSFALHEQVLKRWAYLVEHGLNSANREELLNRYPIPNNFPQLKAPQMNAEIASIMVAPAATKDKIMAAYQNHLGAGISALGKTVNYVLSGEEGDLDLKGTLLPQLSDLGKILTDLFNRLSISRRAQLIPTLTLNKNIKELMQATHPEGNLLFGPNVGEKIKEAKALETVAKQMKPQPQFNFGAGRGTKRAKTSPKKSGNSLNWRAQSRYQRTDRRHKGPTTSGPTKEANQNPQQKSQ